MSGNAPCHDPGGQVRLNLPDWVTGRDAAFSDCGRYRRSLTWDWTPEGTAPRVVLFVGMNPSVATAEVADPTCRRELAFARCWGFTRYLKGNALDWRATRPADLPRDPALACSAANVPALTEMAGGAEIVVLAYGKLHKRYRGAVGAMLRAMAATGRPLKCFGLNGDGSARHPLYLPRDAALRDFPRPD